MQLTSLSSIKLYSALVAYAEFLPTGQNSGTICLPFPILPHQTKLHCEPVELREGGEKLGNKGGQGH